MEELDKIPASRRATTPIMIFFFLTVVEFIAFYLFWLFFSTYSGYYVYFVQRTFLLALLVAGSVTVYRTAKNTKQVILHSALVSIPRSIFFIPFFYLEFLSNVLYDSIDAIALSLFATVVTVILHAAATACLCFIIKAVCAKRGVPKNEIRRPKDLKSTFCGTMLVISLVIAFINFAVELATAITFIVESNGILFISEAVYIIISLLFPIVMLVAMYFLPILIAMWVNKVMLRKIKKAEAASELNKASES